MTVWSGKSHSTSKVGDGGVMLHPNTRMLESVPGAKFGKPTSLMSMVISDPGGSLGVSVLSDMVMKTACVISIITLIQGASTYYVDAP